MEANLCDINHLDADVLLPPRKRLLAGLKKQNSNGNLHPALVSTSSSDFNNRLNNLLSSHMNGSSLSYNDIVEASKSSAIAAVKVAEAARATAEEKAAIAAKAAAAAKSALELVASVSEERVRKERYSKKNKLKKHVPVKLLYKKQKPVENYRKDEELARKLHRSMNSSPRISKNALGSDGKIHRHKKHKTSPIPIVDNSEIVDSTLNGNAVAGEMIPRSSVMEANTVDVDEKATHNSKAKHREMDRGETEVNLFQEKPLEASGRKRGRIKQKKLPLSICTIRDQNIPKEDTKARNLTIGDVIKPVETTSVWKCQFKAPECVKQNKIVHS